MCSLPPPSLLQCLEQGQVVQPLILEKFLEWFVDPTQSDTTGSHLRITPADYSVQYQTPHMPISATTYTLCRSCGHASSTRGARIVHSATHAICQ